MAASPWCSGATQALSEARRAVAGRRSVHVYGQLAAGAQAISELAGEGAVFVTSLDEVPDGATVIFPAMARQYAARVVKLTEKGDSTRPEIANAKMMFGQR